MRVYAFITRRVGDRSTAEDLTSEVFHRALAHLRNYEWRGAPFGAWLMRIASNLVADHGKLSAREAPAVETGMEPSTTQPDLEAIENQALLFRMVKQLRPRTVTAYLHPRRADPLIQFLTKAFGAHELARYGSPDGVIQHASIRIGDSVLEMGEAHGPYQPMEAMLYLYIPDVDTMYHRAMVAGAISVSEPSDQPYGDRTATVKDAFGNQWVLATYLGRQNIPA